MAQDLEITISSVIGLAPGLASTFPASSCFHCSGAAEDATEEAATEGLGGELGDCSRGGGGGGAGLGAEELAFDGPGAAGEVVVFGNRGDCGGSGVTPLLPGTPRPPETPPSAFPTSSPNGE
jgi:hypothetical protein